MKPVIQNPMESAMIEGDAQIQAAARPAMVELLSIFRSYLKGRYLLDQSGLAVSQSLGDWNHNDPPDRHPF
jgi:hypothetical protein